MKAALLENLVNSSWPHWEAEALAKYFSDDADVSHCPSFGADG